MFAHDKQPIDRRRLSVRAGAIAIKKKNAMKLIIGLVSVTKNRTQSERAIAAHQHRGKTFFVRRQQQSVTMTSVSQPLLFTGVSRKNQTNMPTERSKNRFVFGEHTQANRINKETSLLLRIGDHLFARHAQLRRRRAKTALDFPFKDFFDLVTRAARAFNRDDR